MASKKNVTDDKPTVDASSVVINNATIANAGGAAAARHGHFARVVDGEHAGRYGVLLDTITVTPEGLPDDVLIRTRDDDSMLLPVKYADLAAALPGGR